MIASTTSMSEFGSYHFIFQPPSDDAGECPAVEFSVSAEATLTQMIQHFQQFLSSSGYELGNRNLQLIDNENHSHLTVSAPAEMASFFPNTIPSPNAPSAWGNS